MKMHLILATALLAVSAVAGSAAAGTLERIYVCPADMMLRAGMHQQFRVVGLDAEGNEVPVTEPVTWSASPAAGTITQAGLFTAGSSIGMYPSGVTASVPGGKSAVGVIEVIDPSPTGGCNLESSWGNLGAGHLSRLGGIAVGPADSLYVMDRFGSRIQVFDSSGNYTAMWGGSGSTSVSHYYWSVNDVATDSLGNVYTAEAYGIAKFSPTGAYVTWIGGYGTGDGRFRGCGDVAVDASGFIYALDHQLYRIQKFDSAGRFILKWGSQGTGDSQFSAPTCISVGPDGRVYVTDSSADCVKIFSSDGSYITQWGGAGQFDSPGCVEVTANGSVYVADGNGSGNVQRIRKFDSGGIMQSSWTVAADPLHCGPYVTRIAVDSGGNIYVSDIMNNSVHKYTSSGQHIKSWGSQCDIRGQLNWPTRVAVDDTGNSYVLSRGTYCVQKYDSQRNPVGRWGTYGTGDGRFTYPTGIAVGPDNCVYVVDQSAHVVQVFDSNGGFLRKWGREAYSVGGFGQPQDIAVDANGVAYVTDSGRSMVLKFSAQGSFLGEWSCKLSGESSSSPAAVAVDRQGCIYVADRWITRVKKFDSAGNLILLMGAGKLSAAVDVAVAADGSTFVADGNEIDVFNSAGDWGKQIGSFSSNPSQFTSADGVALDSHGNVYATDEFSGRIMRLAPQLTASETGKAKARPDGEFVSLTGQVVTGASSELGDCFYIESPSRSAGIKVTGASAARGEVVSVDGILTTINGEREIRASQVTAATSSSVTPLGMNAAEVGGGALGLQGAAAGRRYNGSGYDPVPMSGPNNIGLLVRVCGKVRSVDSTSRTFMISDGSTFDLKCRIPSSVALPAQGSLISVTGISSTENAGGYLAPMLRIRASADVLPLD